MTFANCKERCWAEKNCTAIGYGRSEDNHNCILVYGGKKVNEYHFGYDVFTLTRPPQGRYLVFRYCLNLYQYFNKAKTVYVRAIVYKKINFADCETYGGQNSNKKCIFPFTWKDHTYRGCPIDPGNPLKRWCSTLVDKDGKHVPGLTTYGYCNTICPIHNGKNNEYLASYRKSSFKLVFQWL